MSFLFTRTIIFWQGSPLHLVHQPATIPGMQVDVKNDPHDQPPLSVHLGVSPSVRQSVHPTIKDFTHGNDFWCAGSWDSHKQKSDPHDHLCHSVCLSVPPHHCRLVRSTCMCFYFFFLFLMGIFIGSLSFE